MKGYETESKAAYTVISNSVPQANQAGTSADRNPVPSKVSKLSVPATNQLVGLEMRGCSNL